jgi:hypothetical protein
MSTMPSTPWGGGPTIRYTIEFTLLPGEEVVRFRAVTAFGVLKAAVMAGNRVRSERPQARILKVELVREEAEFDPDPARDLISYDEVA